MPSDEMESELRDYAGKAVSSAAVAAGASRVMFGPNTTVRIMDRDVQMPVLMGAIAGGSSIVSQYAQKQVFPMWEASLMSERRTAAVLAGATGAGMTATTLAAINPGLLGEFGLSQALFLGAMSEIAGSVLWYNVITPMM